MGRKEVQPFFEDHGDWKAKVQRSRLNSDGTWNSWDENGFAPASSKAVTDWLREVEGLSTLRAKMA